MKQYILTGIDKRYGFRVHISIPQSYEKCEELKKKILRENKIAIPEYQFFSNLKIESEDETRQLTVDQETLISFRTRKERGDM